MKNIFIFLLLTFIFFTNIITVIAVTIAGDTLILYENGKRVRNSSWMHDVYNYAPSCNEGVCYIQQGHNPTFYKTRENYVLDYEEWCDKNTCQSKLHDSYLDTIKREAIYSIKVVIPPPSGGEGCTPMPGQKFCFGGRIGTPRTFKLNLTNGELKEIPDYYLPFYKVDSYIPIIPSLVVLILLLISVTFLFRRMKYKRLNKKNV